MITRSDTALRTFALAAFALVAGAGPQPTSAPTSAPASQPAKKKAPAVRQIPRDRYGRPTLPKVNSVRRLPTVARPRTFRSPGKPNPYQPSHPSNFQVPLAGSTYSQRSPQGLTGRRNPRSLQVPSLPRSTGDLSPPGPPPGTLFYRAPVTDVRTPSVDLSSRGQQLSTTRSPIYASRDRGFYTSFSNARGGTDYLNTRTGRLFIGVDNQNGAQYSIDPRRGTQLFSYDNPNGTTDYFNPRTGRWSFAVPDFAR